MIRDSWAEGDKYELYVGRWSRAVAIKFLEWLGCPPGLSALDVGCATGAPGLESSACDGLHDLLKEKLSASHDGGTSLMERALAVGGLRTQGQSQQPNHA